MNREEILYDAIDAIKRYAKQSAENTSDYDNMILILNHYNGIIKYLEDNLK